MTATVWRVLNWHADTSSVSLEEMDGDWAQTQVEGHLDEYPEIRVEFDSTTERDWGDHARDFRDNLHTAMCDVAQAQSDWGSSDDSDYYD